MAGDADGVADGACLWQRDCGGVGDGDGGAESVGGCGKQILDGGDFRRGVVVAQHDGDDGVDDLAVKLFAHPVEESGGLSSLVDVVEVFECDVESLVDVLRGDGLAGDGQRLASLVGLAGLVPSACGDVGVDDASRHEVLGRVMELAERNFAECVEQFVVLAPLVADGVVDGVLEGHAGDAVLDHDFVGLTDGLVLAVRTEDGGGHLIFDCWGQLVGFRHAVLQGLHLLGDGVGHSSGDFCVLVAVERFDDLADFLNEGFFIHFDFAVLKLIDEVAQGVGSIGGVFGEGVLDSATDAVEFLGIHLNGDRVLTHFSKV